MSSGNTPSIFYYSLYWTDGEGNCDWNRNRPLETAPVRCLNIDSQYMSDPPPRHSGLYRLGRHAGAALYFSFSAVGPCTERSGLIKHDC